MTAFTTDDDAITAYVAQLLETTFTLRSIVDQMYRYEADGHAPPDSAPVPHVLAGLLRNILPPLLERHPRSALEDAAAILAGTTDVVCSEIFFVPPEPPRRRARRPRPRRPG